MILRLDVRIDGFADPVGQLVRDDRQNLTFGYHRAYSALPDAMPLSLSLPIREEPYGDAQARAYFDNLISEQDGDLRRIMERHALERSDIAGLLSHLGKDCPGALSVLPEGAPPAKVPGDLARDYVPLSEARLAEIVTSLHERRRLPDDIQDPSPLAGVQSKIALAKLPDGRLAEPTPGSGAPTTHILKVPEQGHLVDVDRELLALELSGRIVPIAAAVRVDCGRIPALLVERFDREVADGTVRRRHQEDFAQALGLPASMKYERNGQDARRFTAAAAVRILDQTVDPIRSRTRFLKGAIFDLIIGNLDPHAKNHAILHLGGRRLDLAPRYDLLPIRLDPNLTDQLAYRIGEATTLSEITGESFDAFLQSFGLRTQSARKRFRSQSVAGAVTALIPAIDELQQRGQKAFADLIAANMRQLLPVLGLPVPEEARDRDAAIARGGGWASG
jgi:serine/threonine-protein kinase HipA